jgi:hypothetical protein
MAKRDPVTFRHDPTMGEVDPRSYFHLCSVHFNCEKIGDHQRILQLNRLNRAIDLMVEKEGEPRSRVHFTACPGEAPAKKVEVHVQFCSVGEASKADLSKRLSTKLNELVELGKTAGWSVL